jgi:peroxiredoxin
MTTLKAGDMAPDFTLPSTIRESVTRRTIAAEERPAALLPARLLPTCSKETRQAGEILPDRAAQDVEVLGISVDSVWSQ